VSAADESAANGSTADGRARPPAGQRVWHGVTRTARTTARLVRSRRTGAAVLVGLVTLAGIALGLLVGGRTGQDVGPFHAQFSVTPSLGGGTEVRLPPLGAVRLRSHIGPAHVVIDLAALDSARTIDLFTRPNGVEAASATASDDIEHGIARLVLRTLAVSILGAMALAAVVFRSMRRVALCGGLALAVALASLGTAVLTFRRQSIAEPRYEGLLVNARTVVGDVGDLATRYDQYRDQLQRLVTNVSRLYGALTTLPVYEPPTGTIRVLHISDLHLNPAAWSVIATVVQQFHIDVVIDTGDITDWGTEPEASYVNSIGALPVTYVFVRGNHDSSRTQTAVAHQHNAIVLDNSEAVVDGLRIAGIGDPRFTPDKSTVQQDPTLLAGLSYVGRQLAATIATGPPVDIALVHDPASAGPLAGVVPLVLAGHLHERQVSALPVIGPARSPRTELMVEGSTGGAGLRGLEGPAPLPLQLSVLYFGSDHVLKAYDGITVGGTGLAEVTLERHVIPPAPR
jgi:predicted MPP superfamily phosphohydrolase